MTPLGLTLWLVAAGVQRAWGLVFAAALGLLVPWGLAWRAPPAALRFEAGGHYVMIAQALAEGWPTPLIAASCPHLYMRLDRTLLGPATDAEGPQKRVRNFCAGTPRAREQAAQPSARIGAWSSDRQPALWLPASGAQVACLVMDTEGATPGPWQVRLGDGATLRWQPRDAALASWSWPERASPRSPGPSPTMTCEAQQDGECVGHVQWPPVPARVRLCGPLLLRGDAEGLPAGWQLAESAS